MRRCPAASSRSGCGHGGTSNFAFLDIHDARLVALGGLAERYFRDDPSTSIIELRQLAELTARLVAARHGAYCDERETFEEILRRLSCDRIVPREVADILHALRKTGNTAVHEATGEHREALTALKLARSLGVWFHRTYGSQPDFTPGAFIPPAEPVNATAGLRGKIDALLRKVAESEDAVSAARRETEEHARARDSMAARLAPEAEERAVWEQLAQETEAEKVALSAKLASVQAEAEAHLALR